MAIRKTKSWNDTDLINAVRSSTSIRQVIKKLDLIPAGGNYEQVKNAIKVQALNTEHFTGKAWNKGRVGFGVPFIPLDKILVKYSTYQSHKLKNRLFKEGLKSKECEECGWSKYSIDGRLPLELDHVNGNRNDNRIENLRILCPNCHSLKITHRGSNQKIKKQPGWRNR